jgi:hypothetical protein
LSDKYPKLLEFEGLWQLSRAIEDMRGPGSGQFEGIARFNADGAGLAYAEEGRLTLAGQAPVTATRRYLWRPGGDGGISVLFEDGRPFHRIWPGRLMPDDTHVCTPDLYHVAYDFRGWPAWSATWRVVGPRKDYRMVSRYRRG